MGSDDDCPILVLPSFDPKYLTRDYSVVSVDDRYLQSRGRDHNKVSEQTLGHP